MIFSTCLKLRLSGVILISSTCPHIVIFGPIGVGKTPIAEIISKKLDVDHILLDLADDYLMDVGWDWHEEMQAKENGIVNHIEYLNQFPTLLIEQFIKSYPAAVFDCGGDMLIGAK
jgi:hypothetical protein